MTAPEDAAADPTDGPVHSRRPGRPGGDGNSRDRVLGSARRVFTERGYDRASLRRIAADAGVDPGMVRHFFDDKAGLFRAAMQEHAAPERLIAELSAQGTDQIGAALVRRFVTQMDVAGESSPMLSMVRSAVSHQESTAMLRAFVEDRVLARVGALVDTPDRALRASLVGSQIIGLVMARYIVKVEPLASADPDTVVAAVAPTIQRYLTGPLA